MRNMSGPTAATVTGTIGSSQLAVIDLKAYDGKSSVYMRFRFVSDDSGAADGYLIDHLTVTCADTTHGSDAYQYYNGTSMSAASASGAAALVMARKPTLTPTEVRLVIESTVDRKAALTGYVATGGRINLYSALVSMAAVILVAVWKGFPFSRLRSSSISGASSSSARAGTAASISSPPRRWPAVRPPSARAGAAATRAHGSTRCSAGRRPAGAGRGPRRSKSTPAGAPAPRQ